jgi:predicted transcriptional regulator
MDHSPGRNADVLDLESRRTIYDLVTRFAGCHLREIERASGMSFGMVSYHLSYLKRHHLIREERDGNHLRYFPLTMDVHDEKLLALLRQRSVRNILLFIMVHEGCSHQDIVSFVRLSPSTITWHLKKLLVNEIIRLERRGKYNSYLLDVPKELIMNLLITYRESFLDSLVDGFLELWE